MTETIAGVIFKRNASETTSTARRSRGAIFSPVKLVQFAMAEVFDATSGRLNTRFDASPPSSSLRIPLIGITELPRCTEEKISLLEVAEICPKVRSTLSKSRGEHERRLDRLLRFRGEFLRGPCTVTFPDPFHRECRRVRDWNSLVRGRIKGRTNRRTKGSRRRFKEPRGSP